MSLHFGAIFLACFMTIAMFSDGLEPPGSDICQDGKRHARVSVRHIETGGVGYSEGYTTLEGFFAPDPEPLRMIPFLDVRGHIFNNGKMAANAGLGLRRITGCRTFGLNAYYDYRNTKRLHYNQVGVGLETLGKLWDFRLNGYLPVGKKSTSPYDTRFDGFSGHYLLLSQKRQFAMKGADAEIGFHFGKTENFDFYAAAGPYYYIGPIGPNTWGGRARLAAMFKEYITLEVSDSYDRMFHNNFQGQLTLSLPFGGRSRVKPTNACHSCKLADALVSRMVQPVGRDEIIVVGKRTQKTPAIDPATGEPYFFQFVNNTSSSNGTFESPYPTLALAEANSGMNDIIYVFPGDGTTTGMDGGIALQNNQYFWGSGVSHSIQTSLGTFTIPAQSNSSPTITNTDIDTDGNVITLAANNSISGFIITSAINDALYGTDVQSLDVSFCTIEDTSTYAIEASFSGDASITVTNNQFLNNVNGVFLTLNGTSTVVCSDNTFEGQTSVSSVPVEIAADSNVFSAQIERNVFNGNITGTVRFNLDSVVGADIGFLNNTVTDNGTGSQSSLGSSFVVISSGTIDQCSIVLSGNTLSENTSNALYLHTSGAMTALEITASMNTMSDNGGSGLVLATPVDTLTLLATDNSITGCNDNGIAIISSGHSTTGTITINNNAITDIGNSSNGIAINQDFATLNLTILNNEINRCQGTGILSYAPTGIGSLTLDISGNTMSNCANLSSNASAGLDMEQFTTLVGSVTNNTLSGNAGLAIAIGSTLPSPAACLTFTGNNSSTDILLSNPGGGVFNLAPCDVDTVNVGTIITSGTINPVQSCPNATPCPP
ncbi:MAG TPA: inverse autotransporter beta domain-containing protein [Chlamydiales bacterium]|nr:inverse autotransporter beta domain-containing protein [Chlamydiales bacterium]